MKTILDSTPAVGEEWPLSSLIRGEWAGRGSVIEPRSPIDSSLLQRTSTINADELAHLVEAHGDDFSASPEQLRAFCARLHAALQTRSDVLLEALRVELAFVRGDCEEVLEGALAYARDFADFCDEQRSQTTSAAPIFYNDASLNCKRHIRLESVGWGTVVVVLPQSASLLLGLTCLLSALAANNRVILRAPTQCLRSSALLAAAICEATAADTELRGAISVVLGRAKELMNAVYASPEPSLVHYLGSSRHAAALLSEAFEAGKHAIVDGEGNTWVYIAEDADPTLAAQILTNGAVRYNGQTCTSINGAFVHPALYDAVRGQLIERWNSLTVGNPLREDVDVGPLMDSEQAQWCRDRIENSGATMLCGGQVEGNYLRPALAENPDLNSELVTQGLFGPALWIRAATEAEFVAQWPRNRFPLCAGVLSPSAQAAWWLRKLPNLARLVVNGDPSVEHIFEPWGGYPATGSNAVSGWIQKYERVVAIDETCGN